MKIPLGVITLLFVGAAGYILIRLGASTPGMYTDGAAGPSVLPISPDDSPSIRPSEKGPADSTSSAPGSGDVIVYSSLRPSNWDIFLFETQGREPVRLTSHPDLDYNPVLSPDGRWVVFVSERAGNANLYAISLDTGRPPIALTENPGMDDAPAFSPDGTRIAFVSTRGGNPDIYVMRFDPDDPFAEDDAVNLTNNPYGDFNPAFSPDGSRIAFSSNRSIFRKWNPLRLVPRTQFLTGIYVMNPDGSGVERVAGALGIAGSPAWSDDGYRIHYHVGTSDTGRIITLTLDSEESASISPDSLHALTPKAGPDGTVIFTAVAGRNPSPDAARRPFKEIHGGRILRYDPSDSSIVPLTGENREYLSPDYHSASGRLVAHGDGPLEDLPLMANETPFTWPGSVQTAALADRTVDVRMLRAYFPTRSEESNRIYAVQWVHEHKGWPVGPSPIVSAEPAGGGLETVYTPSGEDFAWTPVVTRDDEWIFFSSGPRFAAVDEDVDIWKVRTDGTDAVNLTPESDANDAFPDVSADGNRIVFRSGRDGEPGSGRDGNKEIYLMNAEGESVRRISHADGIDTMPAISPDGTHVVYTTDRMGNGLKLWIQPLDDPDNPGRLLEPERAGIEGLDMHPRFSPDGKWVVFTSDRAGFMDEWMLSGMFPQPYGELFAVPVDGSSPAVRLTHNKWEDALPHWSGTGDRPR